MEPGRDSPARRASRVRRARPGFLVIAAVLLASFTVGSSGGGGALGPSVADAATGEPVPYLPITAVIRAEARAPRTVRLSPMLGGSGFHYGADVTLPDDTTKVTLTLGVAALRTMGAAAGRFAKPVTLSFDWSD